MKVRPVLFSEAMSAAICAGRKTQTRRILKPQPFADGEYLVWCPNKNFLFDGRPDQLSFGLEDVCPLGVPGDRLWVKEAHYLWGHWKKNGQTARGRQKWKFVATQHPGPRFPDTLGKIYPREFEERSKTAVGWFKRPSIFMPRWASRTMLEITRVRVERLHDISEEDYMAEGVEKTDAPSWPYLGSDHPIKGTPKVFPSAKQAFADIWKSINGPDSWEANPWVWVISFKVVSDAG